VAIIDRVKWDATPDQLVWKFPSEELSTWTQLIVNETQQAFLVREGIYDGPFLAGRHTLSTENIPLIRSLIGLPFGGKSPFSAEVWFVNLTAKLDVKWGTPDPLQIEDPKYGIIVPVRSFGQYGIKISDSKKFLHKIVGTTKTFDVDEISKYLNGMLITLAKSIIAEHLIAHKVSVLDISQDLAALSKTIEAQFSAQSAEYGVSIANFYVQSINVPADDPSVITLKNALAKRAELGVLNFTYQQDRTFDVLKAAASNEGNQGAIMGIGLGANVAGALAGPLGGAMADLNQQAGHPTLSTKGTNAEKSNPIELLKEWKSLLDAGAITAEEFTDVKAKILKGI
jgi:membrane protease subunit (stomatin/prohibitin family)